MLQANFQFNGKIPISPTNITNSSTVLDSINVRPFKKIGSAVARLVAPQSMRQPQEAHPNRLSQGTKPSTTALSELADPDATPTPSDSSSIDFDSLPWKKVIDEENLTVELAEVEGSSIKAFRSKSVYNADRATLINVIQDLDNFKHWGDNVLESSTLERLSPTSQVIYYVNKLQWPLTNRDGVITQSCRTVDATTTSIDLRHRDNHTPEKPNLVRIKKLKGAWIIRELEPEKSELTYQAHVDPGGHLPVPQKIADKVLPNTPKNTLLNLHTFLNKQ